MVDMESRSKAYKLPKVILEGRVICEFGKNLSGSLGVTNIVDLFLLSDSLDIFYVCCAIILNKCIEREFPVSIRVNR